MVSIAAFSLSLPTAARCERPRGASRSASSVQVGGFAHGPDENRGLSGFVAGFVVVIISILTDKCPSLGKGVPPPDIRVLHLRNNSENGPVAAGRTLFATYFERIGNFC